MSVGLLASHDWLIRPWYSALNIDGDGPPSGDPPVLEPPYASACKGSKLTLTASGSDVDVHLRVEVWTAEPLTGNPRLDAEAVTWTLRVPAGRIAVSNGGHGESFVLVLPEPGRYHVRINGFNTDTAQLYNQAVARSADWDDPAFQTEMAKLTGRELWLLRLWPAAGSR